jgi:hypothetical protein
MSDAIATVACLPRHRTTDWSASAEGYAFADVPEAAPVSARGVSSVSAATDQDVVIESWLRAAKLQATFYPSRPGREPSPDLAA